MTEVGIANKTFKVDVQEPKNIQQTSPVSSAEICSLEYCVLRTKPPTTRLNARTISLLQKLPLYMTQREKITAIKR